VFGDSLFWGAKGLLEPEKVAIEPESASMSAVYRLTNPVANMLGNLVQK
jgi:hypothetical protein